MSLLDIHVLGSPILRKETAPVNKVDDALQRLIDDMFETMYAARGIGLAAPQIGRTERLTVVDVDRERPLVLINPEILVADGGTELLARCLQHEIDHLHGKLFIDYLSVLKKKAALATWDELKGAYPDLIRSVRTAPEENGKPDDENL
jgi:peptide deformylase